MSGSEKEEDDTVVFIYDRRKGNCPEQKLELGGIFNFSTFKHKVRELLRISPTEEFVVVNTNREQICDNESYELIDGNETLYVLEDVEQELCAPTRERVEYIPHYDTLVKSGMYEYYASEGQNPLPFAFAELLDNALAATSDNEGPRNIEIRLMFDDSTGKHCVCVWDNGQGMTPRQLNNWAIYRLSKFNRNPTGKGNDKVDGNGSENQFDTPRSLNSDISYFGVGGKQACFFIGNSTMMITKTKDCADVHELCISTEEFQRKEQNKESIYSGTIQNRRPGDHSHVAADEDSIKKIIKEELEQDSFTAVAITGIQPVHCLYLKANFNLWCRQLAHIYHYYLHGPQGNEKAVGRGTNASPFKHIDIQVVMYEKGKPPRRKDLREIDDDMQTCYIRSASSVFEFRAHVDQGLVEGVLRYHPFLYDRETFPQGDGLLLNDSIYDPTGEIALDNKGPRGHRPIFECYWNGRLIPYTSIDSLEWCCPPKKRTLVPPECYSRFSGVLWTNDAFQVSTNKLTFMDLENKMKDKNTMFNRVILGQEQRVQISRSFHDWIKECHEIHDKQVKFLNFGSIIKRPELPQKRHQSPWCVFNAIEWDQKVYKVGQLMRTQRTVPIILGTIKRFLLFGEYDGDVFATGGEVEIVQEPVSLYGETRVLPLAKLDRNTNAASIKKMVEEEETKLPSKLTIEWPEKDELLPNVRIPAGTTIGAMKVDIINGRGEPINKLPGDRRKLLVELKVIWHGNDKDSDKVITQHVCQHGGKSWPYWFRKMENVINLGSHTLQLQVTISDNSSVQVIKNMPSHRIKFYVTEAKPDKFTVGMLENPLRIGMPFQIPINLQDEFNNPSKPVTELCPVLTAAGLNFKYTDSVTKGNSLFLKDVVASGVVNSHTGKDFNLKITIPGLEEDSQVLKMRLLPGLPHTLTVEPDIPNITLENCSPLQLNVQVKDSSGNLTVQPRLNVTCKLVGAPNLPTYIGDCSTSGKATLTGADLVLKQMTKPVKLKAKVELQHFKEVPVIEKMFTVVPSTKAAGIEVFYKPSSSSIKQAKKLQNEQELVCTAGETITGLTFNILDEGQRELPIDHPLAARVKVNWTPKISRDLIKQGQLPDVKAPTVSGEPKYLQVSLSGGAGIEFSFTLKPVPDEPAILKSSCNDTRVQLGEPLHSDIFVTMTDKHGNELTKLPSGVVSQFSITAPGLNEKAIQKSIDSNGKLLIKNVLFKDGPLGAKELVLKWKNLQCFHRLEVVPGPPSKLQVLSIESEEQPLSVYNENKLPLPLTIQLCDSAGNHTNDANVKVVLNCDRGIKLTPAPGQQKTNNKGQATFSNNFTLSGVKGIYSMRIRALFGKSSIEAPAISISLEADPNKPSELVVVFNNYNKYPAGESLPVLKAHVVAEDSSILTSTQCKDFTLKMWNSKDNNLGKSKCLIFNPSRRVLNDETGVVYFRDVKMPEVSGSYCMLLVFNSNGISLESSKMSVTAIAGPPVKLVPVNVPATPTVSNTSKATSRQLVRNLKLQLQDKYNNLAGEEINGRVKISVSVASGDSEEIPCLQGNLKSLEIPLTKGLALIQSLLIQENTVGKDGQEYVLSFQTQLPSSVSPTPVQPFTMPFLFYNDVRKQQQMAQLTKERDHLSETIRAYRSLFETTKQLVSEMRVSYEEALQAEQKLKSELRRQDFPVTELVQVINVQTQIDRLSKQKDEISSQPRRQCLLHPGPKGDKDILGKVGHLAQVNDDDVARVLSWHMASDMDCVVTLSTSKAKQVYQESQGQQQVLPLDSIYRRNLPDWNRPLPHIRGNSTFKPEGNPVYARDMLLFPIEAENCKLVFGMLLGDTLILDDLDYANRYRTEVVKYSQCPTILTRAGDRIRSNGKFGGLQNKAPPLERMRGAVFAAPVPPACHDITQQLDQLQAYKQAMVKRKEAHDDLQMQSQFSQTEEMKLKHKECQQAETQLRRIEERLGMTPTRYDMPASPATMLTSNGQHNNTSQQNNRSTTPLNNGTPLNTRTRRGTAVDSEDVKSSKRRKT